MSSLSSFIRLSGGVAVLVLDFSAYQSARASLAGAAAGPIEIYGRPTALHPGQFYFMLVVFGFIGIVLCILGMAAMRKKSK